GYFVTYGYDSLDRMTTVKESGTSLLATYDYDPLSRRTGVTYPNAGMTYSYTNASDLITLNHSHAGTGTVPNYTLTYTNAHELFTEASSDPSYVWQPSAAAVDTYAAANNLNQYPSWTPQGSTSQAFSYDLNGNLTGGTLGNAVWAFTYDQEN